MKGRTVAERAYHVTGPRVGDRVKWVHPDHGTVQESVYTTSGWGHFSIYRTFDINHQKQLDAAFKKWCKENEK